LARPKRVRPDACYGASNGITCITVANLMFEMLCVMADGIASRR